MGGTSTSMLMLVRTQETQNETEDDTLNDMINSSLKVEPVSIICVSFVLCAL